jgi:3-hydroxybutyrate dehydrogenase
MSANGRAALITGSANKLAVAFAEALAAEGYAIMLNDPDAGSAIEPVLEKLRTLSGANAANHAADPRDGAAMAATVEATVERLGSIDVLVNAAAQQHVAPIEDIPTDLFDAIVATNLGAAFHATRAALPHMRRRGWGRIINQASVHGLVASAGKAAYVAAKHGMVGLTKVTALETAGSGITCNAICPGFTGTESTMQQAADIARERGISVEEGARILLDKQPSGQWVPVESLGALVVFLCSEAAAQMTGATIPVEGGWTAQ